MLHTIGFQGKGRNDMNDLNNLVQDALLASAAGDSAQAIQKLNFANESYPGSFLPHFLVAAELASATQFETALVHYERALELEPSHSICRFQYALLLLTMEQGSQVPGLLEPLLELPISHYLNRFAFALMHIATLNPSDAEAPLRQGLASNAEIPDLNRDMTILLQRVLAYKNNEQHELAKQSGVIFDNQVSLPAEVLIRGYTSPSRNH